MASRSALRTTLRRFLKLGHDRAAAMVEFAIIAPLLITMLCGLGDIALSIFAAMQSTNAGQALADLATQSPNLRLTDMNDIYNAAYTMMRPLPSTNLLLRISNVVSNGNGGAFVYWSCGQGSLAALPALSSYAATPKGTAPSSLVVLSPAKSNGYTYAGTNTSFVVVEANNRFTPPTKVVLRSDQVTASEAVGLPRLATYVGFPWNGTVGQGPGVPTSLTRTGSQSFTANGNTISCNYAY